MENKKYKKTDLFDKLFNFSIKIIVLSGKPPKTPAGFAIASQIIRSATSVGANCQEAQDAISRKEFLKSINISLKEARETKYWLEIIKESKLLDEANVDYEVSECSEIIAILTKSVKTIKSSL